MLYFDKKQGMKIHRKIFLQIELYDNKLHYFNEFESALLK